jgi:hypothetical protein
MGVKTYNSKMILVSFGSHMVTGYADDSFVTIEANGDGITKKVGCDGEVVRSIDPDSTAKVTVTLLLTSPTIAWAQKQYDKDRQTGDGTFPVLIKDLKGGLIFSAKDGWVVKPPNREFGREAPDREIEIDCGEVTYDGEIWR